jgi:hypothetical protein
VARQRAAAAALARQGWTLVAPLLAESASLGNGASRKKCAFAVRNDAPVTVQGAGGTEFRAADSSSSSSSPGSLVLELELSYPRRGG